LNLRRILLGALALSIVLSLLVGGHVYIANRLILDPAWPWAVQALGILAIAGLAAAIVLWPAAQRTQLIPKARIVTNVAMLWMGFAFLLLVTLAASDLLVWLGGGLALADDGEQVLPSSARGRAGAVIAIALGAGVFSMFEARRDPRVVRHTLRLPGWPEALDGLRIVQISDIHIGSTLDGVFARRLVDRVNALEPDLIAITGDLVDGPVGELVDDVKPFGGLQAPHGVFFVTGNHDYYSGDEAWVEQVRLLGIRVLRNERVTIEQDGGRFELAGVDDHRGGGFDSSEDFEAALAGWDRTTPLVLLAHDPASFKRAEIEGVTLQLSGHTHGGQIWPFRWLVRLSTPFVAGLYRRAGSWIYVSRGTGHWGPPMRLFAPAEITEHTLRPFAKPDLGAR